MLVSGTRDHINGALSHKILRQTHKNKSTEPITEISRWKYDALIKRKATEHNNTFNRKTGIKINKQLCSITRHTIIIKRSQILCWPIKAEKTHDWFNDYFTLFYGNFSKISLRYKGNWIVTTYVDCCCSVNIVSLPLIRKTSTAQLYLIKACSWEFRLRKQVCLKFRDVCILTVVYALT